MPLVLEVSYENPSGLRHDYDSQLKLGGLFVPVAATEPLPPFAPVLLLLLVDGEAAVRVQTRLTVAGADSLCVEVLPEETAALAEAVERLCQSCDATASKDRKGVRLLAEEPAARDRQEVLTLDRKIAAMSVSEKMRLAVHGGREERAFLGRDRAGPVQSSLVRNVKITVDEVLALARAPHLSPDAAEIMSEHPIWGSSAQIAYALVRNPRTPLRLAIDLVDKLAQSDLRVVAKGLSVRQQVASAARKKLFG